MILNRNKLLIFTVFLSGTWCLAARADSTEQTMSLSLMPVQSLSVKGDVEKFRALNWLNDGYSEGIKDFSFDKKTKDGKEVSFEGHAIPEAYDMGADFLLKKNNYGYMKVEYGTFRKYYDNHGGSVPSNSNFHEQGVYQFPMEPKMDMGKFLVEFGTPLDNELAGLSFNYERETKNGVKNMLSWDGVTQGTYSSTSSSNTQEVKKIAPSYKKVNEIVNNFNLNGRAKVAGFELTGKQHVELVKSSTLYQETPIVISGTNSSNTVQQADDNYAKQFTSSFKADRWLLDDKSYLAFAYQYQHLRNTQSETMLTYNALTGLLQQLGAYTPSSTQNNRGGASTDLLSEAKNDYDSNIWVGNFVNNLTPNLNLATKFKAELISSTGEAIVGYWNAGGTNLPTGTPNVYTTDRNENKIMRTGETVSVRYNGIPKTSLYTDFDIQQERNWIAVEGTAASGSGSRSYSNRTNIPKMVGTVGARITPTTKLTFTSQIRGTGTDNNIDRYKLAAQDTALVITRLHTDSHELDNRLSYKFFKWLESSARVQLIDTIYHTQVVNQDWLKSQSISRVYTYDVVVQPLDAWMFDLAYSLQNFSSSTQASTYLQQTGLSSSGTAVGASTLSNGADILRYRGNVYTWMFTTSYAPKDNLSLFNSFEYSRSKNYNNYSSFGIPYGEDYYRYDMTLGLKWEPKKNWSVEPHYSYYSYRAKQSVDLGNYSAHLIALDAKYTW